MFDAFFMPFLTMRNHKNPESLTMRRDNAVFMVFAALRVTARHEAVHVLVALQEIFQNHIKIFQKSLCFQILCIFAADCSGRNPSS